LGCSDARTVRAWDVSPEGGREERREGRRKG